MTPNDMFVVPAAALLTLLYDSHVVTRHQLSRGFEKLVQTVEDMKLVG
jgi:hypothetical protein